MNKQLFSLGLVCLIPLFFFGCASNQPMMDRIGRLEIMQKTERSESMAEYQTLKQELTAVRTRLDTVSKAQADLMAAMDQQNELIQNAIEKMSYSTSPVNPVR
ncbi:hypothetical protein K8T06_09685, partial [bacterium]|nr:hypothetical protein [bacterium]